MKRKIGTLLLTLFLFGFAATSFAGSYLAIFPDDNYWGSVDTFSWDPSLNIYNLQYYWNFDNDTVGFAVLDYDGYPTSYYWADLYSASYDLYFSTDGATWSYLGTYSY
ncbi:MAG: hypothetical protein D6726_10170 [Nitrospirae bacterium]|nr:MAG: hypothetical protein D6726_10170 [Nitrospirota bacterium]